MEIVERVKSFIAFDFPLTVIQNQFASAHDQGHHTSPHWSLAATRKKVIAAFWYRHVPRHFMTLYALAAAASFLFIPPERFQYLPLLFTVTCAFSFGLLVVTSYLSEFYYVFLPRLETVVAAHDAGQQGRVKKCRQAQLSNLALVLVFYAFDKAGGRDQLRCNDRSAGLLMKLTGVDGDSLKKNLALILSKKKPTSARGRTEILNRFDEALTFLEALNLTEGIRHLKTLETKFRE